MVYVLTDGSLFSDGVIDNSVDGGGKGVWRGDSSDTAGTFMLVYDPDGRPQTTAVGNQLGRFKDNGSVDTSFIFANDVTRLTETVILNYLALHNDAGNLGSYISHGLGSNLTPLIALAALPRF